MAPFCHKLLMQLSGYLYNLHAKCAQIHLFIIRFEYQSIFPVQSIYRDYNPLITVCFTSKSLFPNVKVNLSES